MGTDGANRGSLTGVEHRRGDKPQVRGDRGGEAPTCSGASRPGRAAQAPAGCGGDQMPGSGHSTAAGAVGTVGIKAGWGGVARLPP